jgi:glycosyltransferase involved in cell wall biosynthesis
VKVCLVSSEHSPWGGLGHAFRRLAALLSERHEVTLIHGGDFDVGGPVPAGGRAREVRAEVGPELAGTVFADDNHRRSAAVLEAIERAYEGGGPDYLELADYRAPGLVPLQARRAGHPLLQDTLVGVKLCSTVELLALHDGTFEQPGTRLVADLEREQLRLADRLIWAGGDTLDLYRRYYADLDLPEATLIRRPLTMQAPPPATRRETDLPLRILYVGRLQRLKGAIDLIEACLGLESDEWRLTMVGGDTATAPMGQSVRLTIEAMCGDDPRIRIEDPIPQREVQRRWDEHDLLVLPSRFEVWGNVALEAMRAGLPILATPVGGFAEIVEPGVSGWHTDGVGAGPIGRVLARLLDDRDELERVRASGAPYERFRGLCDPGEIAASYDRLLAAGAPPRTARRRPGQKLAVTAIVPYYSSSAHVEEAVSSLLAQSHDDLDVLIVNDGSFEESDEVLARLAADPRVEVVTQLNRGEPAARNLGASLARGEYLVMLDADNVLEPDFVARAVEVLRGEPELAYVTCWLRMIDPDGSPLADTRVYAALGNRVASEETVNWDGDALAVLPRRIFAELGYRYEPAAGLQSDWELYRCLRDDGRFGAVIPECLARYRVRPESLLRVHGEAIHRRSWDEALSRRRRRAHRWVAGAR